MTLALSSDVRASGRRSPEKTFLTSAVRVGSWSAAIGQNAKSLGLIAAFFGQPNIRVRRILNTPDRKALYLGSVS
jgi:hypothetical protein